MPGPVTRRGIVALAAVATAATLTVLCATVPAVRAVAWSPTWGNNLAALEWGAAGAFVGYLGRDHIGRKAAAWWAKHHGPHAIAQHREALRQHEEARKQEGNPQ